MTKPTADFPVTADEVEVLVAGQHPRYGDLGVTSVGGRWLARLLDR